MYNMTGLNEILELRDDAVEHVAMSDIRRCVQSLKGSTHELPFSTIYGKIMGELKVKQVSEALTEYIHIEMESTLGVTRKTNPEIKEVKEMPKETKSLTEEVVKRTKDLPEPSFFDNPWQELGQTVDESYRDFKSVTASGKIKATMKEVNRKLREVETLTRNMVKLKSESSTEAKKLFNSQTEARVKRIKESVVGIVKNLKELGN